MSMNLGVHRVSADPTWRTPATVFGQLDAEFGPFTLDPCAAAPIKPGIHWFDEEDQGLWQEWSGRVFVNPPYGRAIVDWMRKIDLERHRCEVIVALVPSRTDSAWWHDYAMKAAEIRFIRGRLSFEGVEAPRGHNAPFPSAVLIYEDRAHPDAGLQDRNHFDWFMPTDPTKNVDDYLDDFEAKMLEALTDPFVHDMAQSVLPLIAAYRETRTADPAMPRWGWAVPKPEVLDAEDEAYQEGLREGAVRERAVLREAIVTALDLSIFDEARKRALVVFDTGTLPPSAA